MVALLLTATLTSCKSPEHVKLRELSNLDDVQRFDSLFKKDSHRVGHFGGVGAPLKVLSKGLAYDRYCINLRFRVEKSATGKYKKTGPAEISIIEHHDHVDVDGATVPARTTLAELTEDQWDQVKSVDDFFKIAGITPIKDQPMPRLATAPPEQW